jgi:hypothetical protein
MRTRARAKDWLQGLPEFSRWVFLIATGQSLNKQLGEEVDSHNRISDLQGLWANDRHRSYVSYDQHQRSENVADGVNRQKKNESCFKRQA